MQTNPDKPPPSASISITGLSRLLDNAPDIIARMDREFRHIYINKQIEAATGIPVEEYLGKTNWDLGYPPEICEVWDGMFKRAFKTGETSVNHFEFPGPSGPRFFESRISPEKNEAGEIESVVLIARDITALKESERALKIAKEEAEEANRAKDAFLANMSHELRTPLNAIMGFSDILLEGLAGPLTEKQREYLTEILESTEYLTTLVTNILDVSKLAADPVLIHKAPFDLGALLRVVYMLFEPRAAREDRPYEIELPAKCPEITADRPRIQQVLLNLVSNAFKHSPVSTPIHMSLCQNQSNAIITIHNADSVIPPEEIAHIFEAFYRVTQDSNIPLEGVGLGLYISKKLVSAHGGTLSVESSTEKGTSFTVTLPL